MDWPFHGLFLSHKETHLMYPIRAYYIIKKCDNSPLVPACLTEILNNLYKCKGLNLTAGFHKKKHYCNIGIERRGKKIQ